MKAVISAYARSPFHFAKKGALADVRPDTLAAGVVQGLLKRTDLDPALLEDIVLAAPTLRPRRATTSRASSACWPACRTRWAA